VTRRYRDFGVVARHDTFARGDYRCAEACALHRATLDRSHLRKVNNRRVSGSDPQARRRGSFEEVFNFWLMRPSKTVYVAELTVRRADACELRPEQSNDPGPVTQFALAMIAVWRLDDIGRCGDRAGGSSPKTSGREGVKPAVRLDAWPPRVPCSNFVVAGYSFEGVSSPAATSLVCSLAAISISPMDWRYDTL
jgi:hypothetical protein